MPLYTYECECGSTFEQHFRLKEFSATTQCIKCDRQAQKILTPARLNVDYPGYTCPITNKWIEGKKAHRENLARHNCRVLEPGEHEDNTRRRERSEKELDSQIDKFVEAKIESLPTRQLEKLGEELSSGTTAEIARS